MRWWMLARPFVISFHNICKSNHHALHFNLYSDVYLFLSRTEKICFPLCPMWPYTDPCKKLLPDLNIRCKGPEQWPIYVSAIKLHNSLVAYRKAYGSGLGPFLIGIIIVNILSVLFLTQMLTFSLLCLHFTLRWEGESGSLWVKSILGGRNDSCLKVKAETCLMCFRKSMEAGMLRVEKTRESNRRFSLSG